MQVCLLLVLQLYFPLFSVKVAADHARNTRGKFPSLGPWCHSALVTKSFMVTILQFVGRFIVGFGVSLSAIAECIYISETAPAVSTVIMTLPPRVTLFYFCINEYLLHETTAAQLGYVYGSLFLFDCLYSGMRL